MTIQKAVDGRIHMMIDGRDLELGGTDDHMVINMDPKSPHKMRLSEVRILPHVRAGSLAQLAMEVLEAADSWLSTKEILEAITPLRDEPPSKVGVENALKKLEADGKVESCKRGANNALHWQQVL